LPLTIKAALRICPPEDRGKDFSGEINANGCKAKPFHYLSARTFWDAEVLLYPLGMQQSSRLLIIADMIAGAGAASVALSFADAALLRVRTMLIDEAGNETGCPRYSTGAAVPRNAKYRRRKQSGIQPRSAL
jgi:hypothetical protein